MANWTGIVLLKKRGVDSVSRLNKATRRADFRRGKRLGHDDHIVRWRKPSSIRSVDWPMYKSLPEYLTVREARIRVEQPGFRTKSIVVVTTLLDPVQTTKEDLALLYRARWNNELDLRSIKTTMQMDILRGKTPELVHKEIWTHVLAYNLIRTIMAQAATKHGLDPRSDQLQGGDANAGSVPARDCLAGCTERGIPQEALPAITGCHRHPSRRRSAGPV